MEEKNAFTIQITVLMCTTFQVKTQDVLTYYLTEISVKENCKGIKPTGAKENRLTA